MEYIFRNCLSIWLVCRRLITFHLRGSSVIETHWREWRHSIYLGVEPINLGESFKSLPWKDLDIRPPHLQLWGRNTMNHWSPVHPPLGWPAGCPLDFYQHATYCNNVYKIYFKLNACCCRNSMLQSFTETLPSLSVLECLCVFTMLRYIGMNNPITQILATS